LAVIIFEHRLKMPFTFSHPAIVLPLIFLKRQWLSATGLIIGSMTPDFEYFLRMKVQSEYSHTLLGLLWFDLPFGLLLCFLYHGIVRNSLINNSPLFLKERLPLYKRFDWTDYFKNNWLRVVASLLVGAFSHLVWDSFTHDTGFFVRRFPNFQNPISFADWELPAYKLLQHLSTLAGGLFIIITLLTLKKHSASVTNQFYKYWSLVIAITLTVLIVRLAFGLSYRQYGNVIVTVISGGLVSLLVTPLILKRE
jgi:hypothetical protein